MSESPDARARERERTEALETDDFEAGCWDVLSRYPVLRAVWTSEVFRGERVDQHDGHEIRRVSCGGDVSSLGYLLTAERDIESWDVLYRHIRGDEWSPAFPDAGIAVPYTVHGDYIGSVVERANCEAIGEEWGWLVEQRGAYSTAWLEIPLFYVPDEEESEDFGESVRSLIEACGALDDYPLFCEDTDGRIRWEIQEREFDEFVSEVSRSLEDHHEIGPEDDEREALIRDRAMEAYQDGSLGHECETAFSGYFRPDADAFANMMAEELREEEDDG